MLRLLLIAFVLGDSASSVAADVPTGLVRWLETSSRYKDIEYEVNQHRLPSRDVVGQVKMRSVLETGDYFEIKTRTEGDIKVKTEKSYVNGIERAFQHWLETKEDGRRTPEQQGGYGFIDNISWNERRDSDFVGMSLGYRFGRSSGVWKNLSDLIEVCDCDVQISASPNEEVILFKDVGEFGPNNLTHYDIRVTLSKKHEFLPSKLEGFVRNVGKPIEYDWVVSFQGFQKIAGLWIPTKIFRGETEDFGEMVQVDVSTVKLNSGFAAPELEVQFLKGEKYYDSLEKRMYMDGKPFVKNARSKQVLNSSLYSSGTFAVSLAALVGGILLVLGVWMRKRRLPLLLFFLLSFQCASLGCRPSTPTPVARTVGTQALVDIFPASRQNVSARIDAGAISAKFRLVNRSQQGIVLDSSVVATCGCTSTMLSKTSLSPNEECEVIADIDVAQVPGSKLIQLTVKQLEPSVSEYNLLIDAKFEGDWGIESDMLVFQGKPSDTSLASIRLFGSNVALQQVTVQNFDTFCTIVKDDLTESGREIVFSRKLGTKIADNVLGDIRLVASDRVPSECLVRASDIVKAPGKWSPRAISLKPGERKSSELMLDDGFELVSITANEQLSIDRSKDSSTSGEIITVSLLEGADLQQGVVRLEALISIEGEYLKLPLLVLIQKD